MGETQDATPAQHLRMLLARAQNPFDVPDSMLERLTGAVMHQVELQGWRHRNTPPPTLLCSSYRHVFLLSDGSSLTLWELRHDTRFGMGRDGEEQFEIYVSENSLRRARQRVHRLMGGTAGTVPEELSADAADDTADDGADDGTHGVPGAPALDMPAPEEPGGDTEDTGTLFADFLISGSHAYRTRTFPQHGSADHARRLLRRAENSDRPGEDTRRLLSTARRHEIVHVPKPPARQRRYQIWCSVYEHAFLLADGSEMSLYELEHNLSGTGRLVCEVYLDKAVADRAARRRARDRGIDL